MSHWDELVDMLMVRAELEESKMLPETLQIARYIYTRPNLMVCFSADQLDRIRELWLGVDSWFSGFQVINSSWMAEHKQISWMVETASVYVKMPTLVINQPKPMTIALWDTVMALSDREIMLRIAMGVSPQNEHQIMHDLLKLRFLCKRSLVLMEFDPETDLVASKQHF